MNLKMSLMSPFKNMNMIIQGMSAEKHTTHHFRPPKFYIHVFLTDKTKK